MPMYIPRYVLNHILSFKDATKQVGVKGGIKTDSAQCMPIDEYSYCGSRADAPLFIRNTGAIIHHGYGKETFRPNWKRGGQVNLGIHIYSADDTVDIVFNTFDCSLPNPPKRDLWLQCEARGPDLELYDIMRG